MFNSTIVGLTEWKNHREGSKLIAVWTDIPSKAQLGKALRLKATKETGEYLDKFKLGIAVISLDGRKLNELAVLKTMYINKGKK